MKPKVLWVTGVSFFSKNNDGKMEMFAFQDYPSVKRQVDLGTKIWMKAHCLLPNITPKEAATDIVQILAHTKKSGRITDLKQKDRFWEVKTIEYNLVYRILC